ncbi:MAG: class I SAM-dependent methyltransferase [Clostridia bacterium]|nr:class I SAM-dependent methyltransferase [Clostridia bacterium]
MIYDLLAEFYDRINSDLDYDAWADFLEKIFDKEMKARPSLVMDLGCGTGKMTLALAKKGYDMTGIDYSVNMLGKAREAAYDAGLSENILWLCQDIRSFELYGTMGAIVSCLDTINHITKEKELLSVFSLVHNYLDPDGLFIFDVNGKAKFETLYANQTYVFEEGDDFCVWENEYNEKNKLCRFFITLFSKERDGRYVRSEETQSERMYTVDGLRRMLEETGFEFIGAYSDFDFSAASDMSERIYIAARCKK